MLKEFINIFSETKEKSGPTEKNAYNQGLKGRKLNKIDLFNDAVAVPTHVTPNACCGVEE